MNASQKNKTKETEDKELNRIRKVMSEFTEKNYRLPLDLKVEWSGRLKVKWGYFGVKVYKKEEKITRVEEKIVLSKYLIGSKNKEMVDKIAKHEALHYALYKLGKPYRDGESVFENELKKHGLVSTSVSSDDLDVTKELYVWICSKCKNIVKSGGKTRKDYSKNYTSRCCMAKLENKGWQKIKTGQKKVE